ncbi:MAG: diguanylate cyclase, partial [Pirellulaceae bacterium]
MVRLLTKWLEGAGYQVRSAENGRRAVQLICEELPHFLLTDWEMPYMDGLTLCRWLREQVLPRYVYTVLITVRTGQDDVIRGLEAGADSFLKKPVDRDELITRLYSGARVLELEQRLRNLARVEPLTGLFTRNTFLELLEKEWSRASRHHLPMSCAILEVDHGQQISEQFGRQTAEQCVREVARMLAANSRKSDVIAHDGADSFLILLPETGEAHAAAWAERIASGVRQIEIPVEAVAPLRITASAGIAERMHDTPSDMQLLRMAEEALLVAKRSGRDRVVPHRTIGRPTLGDGPPVDPAAILGGVRAQAVMTPLT